MLTSMQVLALGILCGLVSGSARADTRDAWTLAYRPSAPVSYRTTAAEDTETVSTAGTEHRRVTSDRTVEQVVRPAVDGLEVELKALKSSVRYDGAQIGSVQITPVSCFGVRVTGEPAVGASQGLGVIFAEREVKLGEEWTSQTRGSAESPVPVCTRYRVVRRDAIGARPCLVIETTADGQGKLTSGTAISYRARGRVYFDPLAGQILRARSTARTRYDVPAGHRSGVTRRETVLKASLELAAPAVQ